MASAGGAASATSAPAPEAVDRSTKDLPVASPDARARPCEGRRFLVGEDDDLVEDGGGDCVVESSWRRRKPCRATHRREEPTCLREGGWTTTTSTARSRAGPTSPRSPAESHEDRPVGQASLHVDHGRRWTFCTTDADGRDCPRAWLAATKADLEGDARRGRRHACREVGEGKEQERCRRRVEADVAEAEEGHALRHAHVGDVLHAVDVRIQSKPTPASTEQSLTGLLVHLSENLGKRTSDSKSNFVASQDVVDEEEECEEQSPGARADGEQAAQPADAFAWCETSAKTDGTGGSGSFGAALDPARAAVQWKATCEPDDVDEPDVATASFSATHVRSVAVDQCQGEGSCPDRQVFRRCLGAPASSASELSTAAPAAPSRSRQASRGLHRLFDRGAARQERVTLAMLEDRQLESWPGRPSRAPVRSRRHARWRREGEGDVGESPCLASLATDASALLGSGGVRDCPHVLAQWTDAHDGATPHVRPAAVGRRRGAPRAP